MAASPYAKKLAREAGVDYTQAKASGPGGRIVAADVQQLIESGGGKADQAADAGAGAAQPAAEGQVSLPQVCLGCSMCCFVRHVLSQVVSGSNGRDVFARVPHSSAAPFWSVQGSAGPADRRGLDLIP